MARRLSSIAPAEWTYGLKQRDKEIRYLKRKLWKVETMLESVKDTIRAPRPYLRKKGDPK